MNARRKPPGPHAYLDRDVRTDEVVTLTNGEPPIRMVAGCDMAAGTGVDVWDDDGKLWPWFARGGIVRPGDRGTTRPEHLPKLNGAQHRHIG